MTTATPLTTRGPLIEWLAREAMSTFEAETSLSHPLNDPSPPPVIRQWLIDCLPSRPRELVDELTKLGKIQAPYEVLKPVVEVAQLRDFADAAFALAFLTQAIRAEMSTVPVRERLLVTSWARTVYYSLIQQRLWLWFLQQRC